MPIMIFFSAIGGWSKWPKFAVWISVMRTTHVLQYKTQYIGYGRGGRLSKGSKLCCGKYFGDLISG